MSEGHRRPGAVLAAAAAVIGLLVVFARAPVRMVWWSAAFDAAHAPVFALFTSVALWAFDDPGRPRGRRIRAWMLAAGLAALLAVGTEWAQRYTVEGGSLSDLLRDAVGIVAGLLMAAGTNAALGARGGRCGPGFGRILRGAGLALVALSFVPLAWTSAHYLRRNAAFPLLCDFRAPWLGPFLEVSPGTRLEPLDASTTTAGARPPRLARVVFERGTYPGFVLEEVRADWTGYQRLVLDVYSSLPTGVSLVVRVDDVHQANRYDDRYNGEFQVVPGSNVLSIPLDDIRQAPREREMDMRRLRRLVVFAVSPPQPFSLGFGTIRLE